MASFKFHERCTLTPVLLLERCKLGGLSPPKGRGGGRSICRRRPVRRRVVVHPRDEKNEQFDDTDTNYTFASTHQRPTLLGKPYLSTPRTHDAACAATAPSPTTAAEKATKKTATASRCGFRRRGVSSGRPSRRRMSL